MPTLDQRDDDAGDLTQLVRRMRQGDRAATEQLLPIVYDELRRLARREMHHQPADHTLQTTGLMHEAFLKLCRGSQDVNDRQHFLRIAARAMRSVLVDHARKRGADRRRPMGERILLDELLEAADRRGEDLIALDEALERLEALDPRLAQLVDLRFIAGLSVSQAAEIVGLSPRQAAREWETARAWLRRELA